MRGLAKGPLVDKDFFIVLDRLYETLDVRMKKWRARSKKNQAFLGIMTKQKKLDNQALLVERMTVAYDLAAAFMYLHQHRYVD